MTFNKINQQRYQVVYDNGVLLGDFLMDVDGYFYYWPELREGSWEAHVLRAIADKLDEINKSWDDQVARELMKEEKE